MSSTQILFVRLVLRPLWRDKLRTALTTLAVALGVAVVVAIDLAGQAAAGSFHSSLQSLAGKSDLTITAIGGVDQNVLGKLVQLPYPLDYAPRIEDFASINGHGEAITFLGLDLIAHGGNGNLGTSDTREAAAQIANRRSVWVGAALGLHPGETLQLLINDRMQSFTVAGVLKQNEGEIGEGKVIVADIGLAQQVTGKAEKIDSIDVTIPAGQSAEDYRHKLQAQLPGISVEPQGSRTDENRKMLAAFRWNLHVLSYIALVVGAFLVYNTISVSVVRRRSEIGLVRALGATRGAIASIFLAEAMTFSLCGSVLGLFLGRLLAIGAVQLVGSTVQSLYVSSQPAPVTFSLATLFSGLAIGIGVSILAALAPSIEASRVAPVEAMARGREEFVNLLRSRTTVWWAAGMLVLAAVCTQLPPVRRQPVFAYLATMLLVAGTAALIPNLTLLFARFLNSTVTFFGAEALLALRSLRASLGRTSVTIGALATAVAMTASVAIMVGSFRETVWLWMDNQLKADFYLRPAGSSAADRHPTMDTRIADAIERLPGVAAVDRFRVYPISYEGLPASLGGGETSKAQAAANTRFLPGENRDQIMAELPQGNNAIVSEPFANKHKVHPGSMLTLPLTGTETRFKVLGIYYDYSTERGYIILDRRVLLRYLPDRAASNLAVYLKPGADEDAIRHGIDAAIGGRGVLVFTNRRLRREAIAIFDRSFRITYALEAVAVAVAVLGIAGALLALVIDRRRDFALLRYLGTAQFQVRRIILYEAGLLGLLANVVGLVLGTVLSLILVFVINKQSFGWTIQFHWPVGLLAAILLSVYIATILAGLYPARTAIRTEPIEVIHEE